MLTITRTCLPEWIDFNGHMRDAYYVLCVSSANDQMHEELGVGETYQKSTGFSVYNLDTRVRYLKEGRVGDVIEVRMRIMDHDEKRHHTHSQLVNTATGDILAVVEAVLCHVDQSIPTATPYPMEAQTRLAARMAEDAGTDPGPRVGGVGLRKA